MVMMLPLFLFFCCVLGMKKMSYMCKTQTSLYSTVSTHLVSPTPF
jgi:hypothetical protein